MAFTDIFIKRPVLATVVSLLIALIGLRSYQTLTVQEYPQAENAVVTVTTVYVGADAELVEGFITTPLERQIASADGIDYIQSFSQPGVSVIQAQLRLNYDAYEALTQITSKVNRVRAELPEGSEDSTIELSVGDSTASMYMSFYSDVLENNQITDYLTRVVQPQLQTIAGVQSAEIIGARTYAMRVWLQPERMAGLGIQPADIYQVLGANNFLSAVGQTKGSFIGIDLTASTDLHTADEFRHLVIREDGDTLVRLGDVATVELGAESYDTDVAFNGQNATFIGIEVAPGANILDVIARVREAFPKITAEFPEGLEAAIPYDATEYVNDAIGEVRMTLIEALIIVVVVIFLFLGSLRSVLIPAVAVPLSLLGAGFIMLALGYSLNLLTLLALVLAIGLVVDDAIIVVENIHRHIEEGMAPRDAALKGAAELAGPVVAMTLTLVAVYAPIGFLGGLTGTLFSEFAFTLAGAVLISGVVALTLSPMMSAKLLKPHNPDNGGLAGWLDRQFGKLEGWYERKLHGALDTVPVIIVFGAVVLVSCYFLFVSAQNELAPEEDQGIVIMAATGAPHATLDQTVFWNQEQIDLAKSVEEVENHFLLNGLGFTGPAANSSISGMVFKPWSERERGSKAIKQDIDAGLQQIAGLNTASFVPPALPTGGAGLPVQFVVGTTGGFEQLNEATNELLAAALESNLFIFAESDLRVDKPQVRIDVDRDKAAALGLSMQDIGSNLAAMLSGGTVNRFSIAGRSYKVIPQVARTERLNPDQLAQYHIRTGSGDMVPLSTVVSLSTEVVPRRLKRFQQLNAATIQGVPRPGVSMGEVLTMLQTKAAEILPSDFTIDYAGEARSFVNEGSALLLTFFFALVVIYLVLAAQFESFVDPIIMLVTVPMSICGALIFVSLGLTSLNIYSQVGLVTLIGVISKHGILIVEFANQLQARDGLDKRKAIEKACAIRLRPILMTTVALVVAVVPLITASGAGAASRFAIGLVIATGMTIGTLFTLFIVPGMYMLLGRDFAQLGEEQRAAVAGQGAA